MKIPMTEVRAKSERHDQLLNYVTQAVIATDLHGVVTFWNDRAATLYGWTAEEAIGRPLITLTGSPAAAGGEIEVHDRSGRPFIAQIISTPVVDGFVVVSSDFTAIRSEISRRERQHAALAQIGQIALSTASLQFMFAQAAEMVRTILEVDFCDIQKRSDDGRLLIVGGAGWPEGVIGSSEASGGGTSQAGYTIEIDEPVVVKNLAAETRFRPSPFMLSQGVVSGLTVVIDSGEDVPWGVIGARTREPRDFKASDIDFLRTLASTLGQAIERRRAEVELRVRATQQSAIAELSGRVLTADVDQRILERACELIMSGLSVEFATYLETDDNGETLHLRAGHVWLENPPDPIPMDASQAAYSIRNGESVTIADYTTETRFKTDLFVPFGVRTGIAVPVVGPTRKFGVLTAQTRSAKQFSAADVHFMEALAAVFADAMTRELAKHALVESEARFRSVVEGASEIIFSVAATGEIISVNPAFEAITGWRADEWIGKRFDRLISPDYLEEMNELFASIIREPRPIRVLAHMRSRHRGEILLESSVSPKIQRGVVVEVYGFARDVTEERRLEADRNQATRQLELILQSTDEGIYATDVNGRCTLVNRSAAKLLGASPDWLLGSDMHALIHPRPPEASPQQNDTCAILDVVRKAESHSSRDDIFCRADGSPFPVEYTASPIIDRGEVMGSVVAFNDITARRRLESKLEQANRLSSLGRLAATVAHEFNNVLMGIAPFAEVLRREPLTERGHTSVDQIARSVKRGKRITEDILRFTQPSEPVLAEFEAAAWLHTMALEARSLIGPKYSIDVRTPSDALYVIGDAGQLHQSFINLILNARDAMPAGGRIQIRVERGRPEARFGLAAIEYPERFAHFVVEDNGHGMSPETLRHIFEPLFTTKKNGTGLGLSVARHVITRHGGEIFVESAIGSGTRFHLFIPLAGRPVAGVAAQDTKAAHPADRRYKRVLIVEDERPVASGLAALLELEGVETKIVETGREVLPAIGEWKPDAVVLDIGLPDMDGAKVFASIAREYPKMPVVFSSGHGDESQLDDHLSRPNVAFLLKPYDIDTLLSTLDRVVS